MWNHRNNRYLKKEYEIRPLDVNLRSVVWGMVSYLIFCLIRAISILDILYFVSFANSKSIFLTIFIYIFIFFKFHTDRMSKLSVFWQPQ